MIIINTGLKSTFVYRDFKLIRELTEDSMLFTGFSKGLLFGSLSQLILLVKYINKDVTWIHQSSGHVSLLPCTVGKTFGHKNIIIAIGTDSACFPEIDYGNHRKWSTRVSTKASFSGADLICPVDETIVQYDYTYWDVQYARQGILAFYPDLKTPFFPIENGYIQKNWGVDKEPETRSVDVLSVFAIGNSNRSVLKGADLILAIAARRPELRFRIIGRVLKGAIVPSNCEVLDNCTQNQLRAHFNESKIFIQASITEGFPNSLCEAMACGCFPIGSAVSSLPKIISDFGFVLEKRNDLELEVLIIKGLRLINEKKTNAHEISKSIFSRFSMDRRKRKLAEAIRLVSM